MKTIFIANWTINTIREREVAAVFGDTFVMVPQTIGEQTHYKTKGEKCALFGDYKDALAWITRKRQEKVDKCLSEAEAAKEKLHHPVKFYRLDGRSAELQP